ncbi:solid-state culture-specific protein-like protein [Aspergillus steynii IBT 23096]|uniref:Solid-state culture-specific protein-like protein n=1 Tax=Aspergillus steynii IBT 23096 TaxID=1392250 RepID=A0A2I2GAS5_9EURO|nr:solid-state culture-specific protein-like protein [Aspergillus steynii IBT 23096]PLB49979.1 solid-state culture-specific protein-like protein [Aspergillus steynii IBT 23096]
MNPQESVVLDYTLHDLYNLENASNEEIVLVYAYPPPADIHPTSSTPALTKFPIQSPLCPIYEKEELAKQLFHGTSQRFGFCSGPMSIAIFDLDRKQYNDNEKPAPILPHHADTYNTFNQLPTHQRPHPEFLKTPADLKLPTNSRLAITVPLDWISHLPHITDPNVHYNLLSKRGLAHSGLPTPKTTVIDTHLSPTHTFTDSELTEEITRMTAPIRTTNLPFILKVPRVASIGQGTFIIRSETDRVAANAVFQDTVRKMLMDLTPSNAHLSPCNLVMQDMVDGETVGITFFVTQSGQAIFNCCTRQEVDGAYCWSGGLVSYNEQEVLEERYREIIATVARFLHRNGYFGPAGVDVMTDSHGEQLVVDLNVRITGTYHLGPLKGHFAKRGFVEAAGLANQRIRCSRGQFEEVFGDELRDGSLLVTATTSKIL